MNSEQKFKDGDALRMSFEATNRTELLIFTDRQQVYKTRLSDFDDTKSSALGTSGVGVMRISDFYRRFTGCSGAPEAWRDWLHLPSYALAQAVSGEVFRDDLGEFSRIRNEIAHGMPEDVRRKKLAARLAFMAQSG